MGVIFFQMIFGKVPYTSVSAAQMYQEIKSKKILNSETFTYNGYTASKEVTTFLREVMVIENDNRLGWKSLVKHPLFKDKGGKLDNEFRIDFDIKGPQGQDDDHKFKEEDNFSLKVP
jgi:serine/threonine protein kinase